MNRTITFVSLGPGEPELITLKGLKTLQQADRIFCPATLTTSGKQTSRAAHILRALEIEEKNNLLRVPPVGSFPYSFQSFLRLLNKTEATTGAPTSAVTELTGKAPSKPGIRASRLQINAKAAPNNKVAGIKVR